MRNFLCVILLFIGSNAFAQCCSVQQVGPVRGAVYAVQVNRPIRTILRSNQPGYTAKRAVRRFVARPVHRVFRRLRGC